MTDSLLYYLNVLQNSDTINNNFTIADTTIVSQVENLTFLQFDNVDYKLQHYILPAQILMSSHIYYLYYWVLFL